jgi:ankyrin repeat protein
VILRRNDLRRLAGYAAVERQGKNKDNLQGEMLYTKLMCDMLPAAEYPVDPLYSAAYNGDDLAIVSLARLHVNPNSKHPSSGYTALHAAVFRCKIKAVGALLDCFRGTLVLEQQDKKGDTALHLASRMGYVEIAGLICDEAGCDPLRVTNLAGKYPIDEVRSHKVWQVIKVCQTRNELQKELAALRARPAASKSVSNGKSHRTGTGTGGKSNIASTYSGSKSSSSAPS